MEKKIERNERHDKKIKQLEMIQMWKSNSKIGPNLHFKTVHTKLYKVKYPLECDFCANTTDSGE